MTEILMPKATAVWLIENTSLTFEQIADFCGLHPLEVKGIADGDVAAGVRGADPIANGQLNREEILAAENNPARRMVARQSKHADAAAKAKRKGPRFVPVSRRQERPNAIAWLVKHHPEVPDSQIAKLLGTTKATIEAVRSRTHWNASNVQPQDPVGLGLCSQVELDEVVRRAAEKRRRELARTAGPEGETLKPAAEPAPEPVPEVEEEPPRRTPIDADSVFAKLGGLKREAAEEDEAP